MKYFLHDTNALDDEKVTELFMNFGYEGVGLFYCILEKIAKQEKPIKTLVLKKQLSVGKKLDKCWCFMESLGLIHSSNDETFNKQLLNFSEKYKIKKENNAKRISEWREKQTVTENVTRNESVRNTAKVKESKVKESKVLPFLFSTGEETELYNIAKNIFLSFYKQQIGSGDYFFKSIDGQKIKSILKQLIFKMKEKSSGKKEIFTEAEFSDIITLFFSKGYDTADDWLKVNFTLSNIDSKFNTIYTAIKNGKQNSKNGSGNKAATPEGVVRAINEMFNTPK